MTEELENKKNLNKSRIPKILTFWRTTIPFLAAVFAISTIFVFIYDPVGAPKNWSSAVYNTILTGSAFIVLMVSRIVMYFINRGSRLLVWQYALWLIAEILLMVVLVTLLSFIFNHDGNILMIITRAVGSIVCILFIPSSFSLLFVVIHEQKREISRLSSIIDRQDAVGAAANSTAAANFYDRGGKLAFSTRRSNVLYIESADNYCNIHYMADGKENTFILHNSMKYFENNYISPDLIRCHRGYIVNITNVHLLKKDGDKLLLELTQGSTIPVSRSYKSRVISTFTALDTTQEQDTPMPTPLDNN